MICKNNPYGSILLDGIYYIQILLHLNYLELNNQTVHHYFTKQPTMNIKFVVIVYDFKANILFHQLNFNC